MKVIVASKNPVYGTGLTDGIKKLDSEASVISTDNLYNLFTILSKNKDADYIFVDFKVLGEEWRRQLKRLCDEANGKRIVFFAEKLSQEIISFLFASGCYGYIPSNYKQDMIFSVLHLLFSGCAYIPPSFLNTVNTEEAKTVSSVHEYRLPDGKTLTPRQVEVLGFLGRGLSNKQIAFEMSVSEATVKLHINALLKNLDVNNRTQAVISAQRFGFL